MSIYGLLLVTKIYEWKDKGMEYKLSRDLFLMLRKSNFVNIFAPNGVLPVNVKEREREIVLLPMLEITS